MTLLVVAFCVVSIAGHVWGYLELRRCKRESAAKIATQASRIDSLENGTTMRLMQHFCEEMERRIARSRAELDEAQVRLGAALMACAEAEERVARMLSAGVP